MGIGDSVRTVRMEKGYSCKNKLAISLFSSIGVAALLIIYIALLSVNIF
jgi:hypothetical protein